MKSTQPHNNSASWYKFHFKSEAQKFLVTFYLPLISKAKKCIDVYTHMCICYVSCEYVCRPVFLLYYMATANLK